MGSARDLSARLVSEHATHTVSDAGCVMCAQEAGARRRLEKPRIDRDVPRWAGAVGTVMAWVFIILGNLIAVAIVAALLFSVTPLADLV